MSDASTRSRSAASANDVWIPFFWAAIAFAVVPGFALGGLLFVVPAAGRSVGTWWLAAARVHGHVQLVGWAGLMVLGVGLYFLPRLRGRPLDHPGQARAVLALLVSGLVLRMLTEPLLAASGAAILRAGLVVSGVLELAGVSAAIALLARTMRGDPPVRARAGLLQVLPFLVTAFLGFWLAMLTNLVVVALAVGASAAGATFDRLGVLLALYVFLVPISVGMAARLFPLHFAVRPPRHRLLRAGLLFLVVGMLLRVTGEETQLPYISAVGLLCVASALALFVSGLQVFAPRRAVPGGRIPWYTDAAQWHGLSALAWLALDAVVLARAAWQLLGEAAPAASAGAERHILGAGFVTLLILGEGANLLPGFAHRPLRSQWLVWATLSLGNLAAVLRVAPNLLPQLMPPAAAELVLASSGGVGVFTVVAFAANLGRLPARTEDEP